MHAMKKYRMNVIREFAKTYLYGHLDGKHAHGCDRSVRHTKAAYPFLALLLMYPLAWAHAQDDTTHKMTGIPPELADPTFFQDTDNGTTPLPHTDLFKVPKPASTLKASSPDKAGAPAVPVTVEKQVTSPIVPIIPAPTAPAAVKVSPSAPIPSPKGTPDIDLPKVAVDKDQIAPIVDDYSPTVIDALLNPSYTVKKPKNITLIPSKQANHLLTTPAPATTPAPSPHLSTPSITPPSLAGTAKPKTVEKVGLFWQGSLMFNENAIRLLNKTLEGRTSGNLMPSLTDNNSNGDASNPGVVYPPLAPVFYLNSIVYFSPTNWTIWLNSEKLAFAVTPFNTALFPDIHVMSVLPNEVTITWSTTFLNHLSPNWGRRLTENINDNLSNEDETIILNPEKDTVKFTLRPNQAFAVYYMEIFEGNVEPTTVPPPVTTTNAPFLEQSTDERLDTLKEVIKQ